MARLIKTAGVLTVLLASGAAQAIAAAPLPALVQPASHEHLVGKIIYAELVTPDVKTVEPFYAGLFGWTFRDVRIGRHAFTEALLDGKQVAGLVQRPERAGSGRHPAWLTFISASAIDATRKAATQNGATLLYGPRSFPDLGDVAVFKDPEGAVFGVLSSSSGDPPDLPAVDGDWVWSSLITSDPASGAAFYRSVFGYDVYDLATDGPAKHIIMASDNYARASINSFPAERPNAHPRWLDFIQVEDVAAMAAKARSLGGHVLLQPRVDHNGSSIAIVADPSGAALGLMQVSDNQSAGDAK